MDLALPRCAWVGSNPLMIGYHDDLWGYAQHDDPVLFEQLVLETFQAGLSWELMLKKREHLRRAFHGFDPEFVAALTDEDVARLLADPSIIRNRAKIKAAIGNARVFLQIQRESGSFDSYIWQFTGFRTIRSGIIPAPALSPESEAMFADLRKRGFRFVGPTTCYAYMQSIGMVDDHEPSCFRYSQNPTG